MHLIVGTLVLKICGAVRHHTLKHKSEKEIAADERGSETEKRTGEQVNRRTE
jgi:hypothetical protein